MSDKPYIDEHNVLHILNEKILPGQHKRLNLHTAKLYTTSSVDVPVIIERSKKKGPVVLVTAGIHGDELNGVEIVRQFLARKMNKPLVGTIICIPVMNVFGFINMQREFPDGRDLNRIFPGAKKGPLASRFAFQLTDEILPAVDYAFDFHTGGAKRFNAAQIRISKKQPELLELAKAFSAPFVVYSSTIKKSYRMTCQKLNIPVLLFEGGKSADNDPVITKHGLDGLRRVLKHLGMLKAEFAPSKPAKPCVFISKTKWIRAKYSGLLHLKIDVGQWVDKGEEMAHITDPYGSFKHILKARDAGYVINVNQSPMVYQGDALFHISTQVDED
ncbi:succinylglutamate desuccinylase/aspartoacylase family protein [Flavobacteriaceae bacterium 14752]|uniref:succinylglutamate desuccinylase/aspartoacylase family protein n=1 Tax=Mesohalobacter salilacus TaxID=2491711 RepID=UPI000F641743|nr:succinylglutamate desuccinylase/aspartoacylase family protein [Flavobacteriaceae bacterium 14752]